MGWRNLLLPAAILAVCAAIPAQSPDYGVGKTPSAEELHAWDIHISPEGKGLPAGSGTADEGAKIFVQKCAVCHGVNLTGGQAPALTAPSAEKVRVQEGGQTVLQSPFAPVIWDYIRRAMPLQIQQTEPGTLNLNEVYSLTAFLLYKNGVIKENDVLNAQTLPQVRMPNRDAFIPPVVKPWRP